jgi:hypothetical protein
MNAESDESDDDIHGEGSHSQQQDLQMQENQAEAIIQQIEVDHEGQMDDGEEAVEDEEDFVGANEEDEYDEENPREEEDPDEDEGNLDEMEDDEDLGELHIGANHGHVVDDAEEDLMEGDLDEHEMDGEEQEDEMDDDFDDLPSDEEDDGRYLPWGMAGHHGRHRGGRSAHQNQRDILFSAPDGAGGGPLGHAEPLRLERAGGRMAYLVRASGAGPGRSGQENYGPNWSREEEEVSQILRNLRGLSAHASNPPLQPNPGALGVPPNQSYRYRIEMEVCSHFSGSNPLLSQAKKSIE